MDTLLAGMLCGRSKVIMSFSRITDLDVLLAHELPKPQAVDRTKPFQMLTLHFTTARVVE